LSALIDRRLLLKSTGALVVTFAFGPHSGLAASDKTVKPVGLDTVDSYLAIDSQGSVTVYSGKVDLGTGVRTALTQMVAEELDVAFDHVTLIQGDTELTPDQGVTYGSLSIQNGGAQLRQAAATARQMLLQLAAVRMKVTPDALTMVAGVIIGPQQQRLPLSTLIGKQSLAIAVDKGAPLKNPDNFKLVGQPVPRVDIPDKVTGQFTFMQDFKIPGMLHGRVIRPTAMGAKLLNVDESSIAGVPGIVKVVRQENFIGVVAKTEWSAIRAARELAVLWSDRSELPAASELWQHVRQTKVVKDDVTSNKGDSGGAMAGAIERLQATYNFAIHTHGSIGPSCAVAHFDGDKLTCWSASQATHNLRKQLAAMLSIRDEQVRCIYVDGAGCYGRNAHEDAAADAALLARATGAPVRVQWMREDEHGWDPKGPPTLLDMRAGIDSKGKISAWESELFVPDGAASNVALLGADHAGLDSLGKLSPGGVIQDLAIPYSIDNVKTVAHRLASTPFRPSWIRSPGRMQNSFANESFFDEIAIHLGKDPLDARLEYLDDARGKELLERLATLSHWRARQKPDSQANKRIGWGLAYIKYELVRTYVGVVCEVEADRKSGIIAAKRFFVAHDCGQIINPDGLRNQIEGNVVQTVSRVLMEELKFSQSRVTSVDWNSYPILRFPDVPQVVIDLIDRPHQVPWGGGEPTAALIPAAISNAVFDAIGVRLRSVPFTAQKVRAAIEHLS
jgi:nicotinate dehydrogenase subunit B